MIINHNISAQNTLNALGINNQATNKSLQKLSTGLRINGASDDAAGLAISEKMRGQISGLKQASANAQDGISLLQTAEGGLDQTHSILQRMRELAVQSATDTNTADDRAKIQAETDQLAKEITRISNTTEFNTQNLLAGGLSDTFHIGANAGQNLSVSITAMDAQSLGVAGYAASAASVTASNKLNISSISRGFAATASSNSYSISAVTVQAQITTATTQLSVKATGFTGSFAVVGATNFTGAADTDYLVKVAAVGTSGTNVTAISYSKDYGVSWTTVSGNFTTSTVTIDGMKFQFNASSGTTTDKYTVGDEFGFSVDAAKVTLQLHDALTTGKNLSIGASVEVHRGDTKATVGDALTGRTVDVEFDFETVLIQPTANSLTTFNVNHADSIAADVASGVVRSKAVAVAGIDVSTQANANSAITTIDRAINTVSQQRSALGAYQNRLTNTIDNLNTSNENISASESRIRDVDMSSEMMTYQKNNILQQAATAMLAKANQQPQSVLQLLQG